MNKKDTIIRYHLSIKKTVATLLFVYLFLPFSSAFALDYFWVGGSGNWSDLTKWATASGGGTFHTALPSIGDNVFFDINSFPSPASKTVTIDVNAECRNMSWAGATNTPILTGTTAFAITVYGNLNFIAAMNNTFAGKFIFSAITAGQTVTSAGQTFQNVDFTVSTLGSGSILQDNFVSTGTINLLEGTLNTNGVTVTCNNFIASNTPKLRALNMNNSAFNVTGAGTPLDFRGDDANFSLISNATSLITLSNAAPINILTGLAAKTIPSMVFTNTTDVTLTTGSGTAILTLRNITINQSGANLAVNGNCIKNYGNILMGNSCIATFTGNNIVSNTFNGTVTFGNNSTVTFGNNNIFNQNILLGNNTTLLSFLGANVISANLTVGTTSNVVFSGASNLFTGLITLADFSEITFSNAGVNNFNNANIGQGVVWKMSTAATSNNVNGIFTTTANCNNLILITSNVTGLQANMGVANTQTWNFVTARDLNKTGAGILTVVNGANAGNNTGISFTSAPRTLFWVGNGGDWNNSAKWSLTSGGAGGQCPPTSIDDVVFDASSFSTGGQAVNINIDAFCRNMTWAAVTNSPKMAGANQLNISGSLTLSPTMLQTGTGADFSGDVFFSSTVAGNTITMAGKAFNNVRFEGLGGAWQLNDAATVLNNLDIFAGNLNLNNQALNTGRLSTAAAVDVARGLNFTSSLVNINGNGTALNLGGNAVTINEGTSTINLNNNGTVTVETGAITKTIPNLIFTDTDATVRTITVNTPSNASTITFKNIEVRKQRFVLNGTSKKVFSGTLLFFNEVASTFNGSAVVADNIFNNTLTFQGRNTTNFNIGATFNQNVTFLDGINLGSEIKFTGNINFAGTLLFLGNNINATFTGLNVFKNMIVGTNSFIIFDENNSTFDNLTLDRYTSVRFAQNKTTTFNQTLNAFVNCDSWISLGSSVNGSAANMNFVQPQTWQGLIIKDINAGLGVTATANNSSSGGNNTNINFVSLNPPKTLYWIGGALGDWSDGTKWSFTSGGATANCVPTSNDDVIFDDNSFPAGGGTVSLNLFLMFCRNMTWTNNTNAGTLLGTEKILQVYGNVIFNGAKTINNYSGNIEFWGNSIPATKTITSNGTPFFGPVLFNNNDTWVLQDALDINNGAPIVLNYGVLDMNNRNVTIEGDWTVNIPAVGSGFAQATFLSGTNTITFDGKNNVQAVQIPELVGGACVECSCSTSQFNNLIVDKSTSLAGRRFDLETSISIKNNFIILNGDVWDNGFQIRGNTVGAFTMVNNTALRLGSATVATVFPTCFVNINISAGTTVGLVNDEFNIVMAGTNPAIVEYRSSQNQLVKNITYGTLLLTSPNTASYRTRMLQGTITVNGSLIIGASIWLKDMGFQITGNASAGNRIFIDAASVLSLGTGNVAGAAIFALGYPTGATNYTELTTLPTGIPLPMAVATNTSTTFPTFTPIGDFLAGMGKMQIRGAVSYTSGAALQNVLAGFTYIHLYAYGQPFVSNKEVIGVVGTDLRINGNFLISSNVNFKDKGFQLDARGNLFLQSGAGLWIGEGTRATKFPPNLPLIGMNLAISSQVRYNADVPQEVSTRPTYESLFLTAPGVTSGTPVPKTMVPTSPVKLGNYSYIAPYNNLIDNGAQIYSDAGYKQFFMDQNSVITLGNVAIATNLPTNFDWIFQPNSTVVYNSNQLQLIDIFPPGRWFQNLTISTSAPTPLGIKELQAPIRVDNDFLIKTNNTLNDKGFQINQDDGGYGLMTMEAQSTLIVGSATSATRFPAYFERPLINLDPNSTVIFTSDLDQVINKQPIYGNLIVRKVNAVAPISNKILSPQAVLGSAPIINWDDKTNLLISGNLTIESFNNLDDNGQQIIGIGVGKTLLAQNNAQLTLGSRGAAGIGTLFPNQFVTIDLSPTTTPSSTVVFNSDKVSNRITGLNNAAVPFSYGNLTLFSNGTAVTKNLLSSINVRRNLTINTNNTLDATGSNFNIIIGGNWLNAGGVFNARTGKVTFDGTTNQNITSNNSDFFSMEFTNPQGVTMQDNMTAGGIVTFTNGVVNNLSGQLMTFKNNATVAAVPGTFPGAPGPSNNSFVNGRVRKIGNQAFIFPVGSVVNGSTQWFAPIGITAPTSVTAQFSTIYVPQNPHPTYNRNIIEPSLNHISEAEYWLLDREVSTDNVRVTLSWDTPRSGGVNFPTELRVAHWRSAAPFWWANGGNNSSTGNATRGTLQSSVIFDNFSPFTLGSIIPNNPLPIELVNFTATPDYGKKVVDLRWQTASETNNDFFTLEKSKNGTDFRPFATELSKAEKGSSQQLLNYQLYDNEPFGGLSYYRLKQTDLDGTSKYSKIVPVRFEHVTGEDRFMVYPNPTEGGLLNVQFLDSQIKNGTIVIYDMLGKLMLYQNTENQSADLISLHFREKLPAGSYIIRIISNDKVYTKKFSVF